MKHKLLSVLSAILIALTSYSQGNGGIAVENGSVKLEWVSTSTAGGIIVKVTNKQICLANIRIDWGAGRRTEAIAALASDTFWLPVPSNCLVTAKPMTNCHSQGDMGRVELNICTILPIKFKKVSAIRLNPRSVRVIFQSEEDSDLKYYNILISDDGKTYRTVQVVFPNGIKGNKVYTTIVNY